MTVNSYWSTSVLPLSLSLLWTKWRSGGSLFLRNQKEYEKEEEEKEEINKKEG